MQIKYNVTGDRRKALVAVMRDTLQDATRYLGAPSFAFQVGKYTVDKNGTVTCPDDADAAQIDTLISELAHDGFIGERIGEPEAHRAKIIETPRKGNLTPTLDSLTDFRSRCRRTHDTHCMENLATGCEQSDAAEESARHGQPSDDRPLRQDRIRMVSADC